MSTYYINADSGSDSTGTGTSVNPWLTITKAVTGSTAGDTIILQAASNYYTFPYYLWSGGGSGARTFTASVSGTVKVGGGSYDAYWTLAAGNHIFNNIDFCDFTSTNTNTTTALFNFYPGVGTATFNNCRFYNLNSVILYMGGIFGLTGGSGSSFILNRCTIYNVCHTQGFTLFTTSSSHTLNVTMYNCVVSILSTEQMSTALFRLNYSSSSGTINFTAKNNIFKLGGSALAFKVGGTFNATTSYNCYNGSWTSLPTLGTGDITTDPLFLDETNRNFTLRPTSPCINTGTLI